MRSLMNYMVIKQSLIKAQVVITLTSTYPDLILGARCAQKDLISALNGTETIHKAADCSLISSASHFLVLIRFMNYSSES